MFIFGICGVIVVFIMGGVLYFVFKKNIYVMVIGVIMGIVFIGFFKYIMIGNNIDQIRCMCIVFDLEDKFLQV